MTNPAPLSLRALVRADWRWLGLLGSLPFLFLALLVLPSPFGRGLDFGNDFGDHRIWWIQMDAFWLSHGQVPLWNPVDQFGVLHAGARGMAEFYPFRWWLYLPAIWAPQLNYPAQYVQIALHMSFALAGIFVLLRRHTSASPAAAAFAAMPFLLTQRFVDFVRYPQGIEAAAWLPWILVACLECSRIDLPAGNRLRWAWRLAAATALSFLAGYGHLTYIGGLLVGVILLCTVRSWHGLALAGGAALLGLVVAAGSLYPAAVQTLRAAGRSGGDPAWANQFLPPGYLDMWLRPFAAEIHGSAFFPPVYLALGALGVIIALRRSPRRLSLAMLIALVLVADLAQGSNGVLFAWFYENMPMYHAFRNHGRSFWPALIVIAYFSAQALGWIEQNQKRTALTLVLALGFTLILGAFAWQEDGPLLVPAGHLGYSALDLGWATPRTVRWGYGTILIMEILALGGLLFDRRSWVQMASCVLLTAAFVLGFAQFGTWFVPERPHAAETGTREAYPNGVFETYQARPMGILGVWGMDDPPLAQFRRYTEMQPSPNAVFPASRFHFLSQNPASDTADVRVRNFGANHFDFEVRSSVPGTLIYFARPGLQNRATGPWRPWPQGEELFLALDVSPGTRLVQLSFAPAGVIAAGLFSLCGIACLIALTLDPALRSRGSRGVVAAGVCAGVFFLVGTLARHPLDARTLTGASNVNPFKWHAVPAGNQTFSQP